MTRATTCRTSPNYPTDEWTRRAPRAWHARGIRRSGERSEKGGCRATEVTDRRGVPVILEGGVGMNRFVRTLVAAVALLPLIVPAIGTADDDDRSEEHTSELQSRLHLVCRLLLEKKKQQTRSVRSR